MSSHTVLRVLHDVGGATWFGGSLMGATGLNSAAALLDDPSQRSKASTAGWSRWAPVGGAAVLAHTIGAAGLARTDAARVATQKGVGRSSAVKTGLTAAGLGVSAWSALLNRKMAAAGPVPVQGSTEPSFATPPAVAKVQRQLKVVQWLNPLIAGAAIGVGSWQSEQQRTSQVVPGVLKGLVGRVPKAPLLAAVGVAGLVAARRRSSAGTDVVVESYPPPPVVHAPADVTVNGMATPPPPSTTTTSGPTTPAPGTVTRVVPDSTLR